ncbi:Uncharacterized protein FWK35_00004182, partial [Aphis craccivora]
MLCFFFVCLCIRENVEIMLQFQTLGVVSDSKMNLVGALGRSFFEFPNNSELSDECIDFTMIEYPWCIIEVKSKYFPRVFKKIEKNKKKVTEKREFLRKTSFRPNRFFNMVVIQKLITNQIFILPGFAIYLPKNKNTKATISFEVYIISNLTIFILQNEDPLLTLKSLVFNEKFTFSLFS